MSEFLSIDGRPAEARGTILDACRSVGAAVPHLCHDGRIASGGHCRSCLVEADGRHVAACTTPARAGTTVLTHTPELEEYRRDLGELMLAEARPGATAAGWIHRWGAEGRRYARQATDARKDATHPYLRLDMEACIRCRLCERACEAMQGNFVFHFSGRGVHTRLRWGADRFVDSACVSCGACVTMCPTGAITDRDRCTPRHAAHTIRTTCGYCGVGCQLDVHVAADGTVHHIDGHASSPVNRGHLCLKGRYAHAFTRHPDRLTTPLIRRNGKLEPASWEEAIALVADRMRAMGGKVAALSSARCTNEENYLLQKWMRAGFHSNDVDCCARVCHGPSAAGMRRVLGTGAATNSLEDIEQADCLLVSGSNATEAHPVTGARIRHRVLAGGARLVVIDPRRTELAALADVHLQLKPGTNVPLLHSLAHVLVTEGLVRNEYVDARCDGFLDYAAFLQDYAPEATETITGVPAESVRRAARLYGTAANPMQAHGLGMTEHYQGSESVMLLCNLALLVGAVGREGVGVNPLRGQNNVQGAADMGCAPDLLPGYQPVADAAVRARVGEVWGAVPPDRPGRTIPGIYDAIRAGEIRGLFILGEDVVQTDPATHVGDALDRLELLVVQELFLTRTAERATVVLPGAGFLEKDGSFTNGERRIQRVRKAVEPPAGAQEDWRTLLELMAATDCPQPFDGPAAIMDEIARVVPAFRGVSYARLDADGLQWPVPSPEHPGTSRLHTETFPVGKARFATVPFLPSPSEEVDTDTWPLRLVTGRRLEHYNCGSMTRRSENAAIAPEDEVVIHPEDAVRAGVRDGDRAMVESPWGVARARARVSDEVAEGTCFLTFHFPETGTNDVISPVLDRLADCPEYKLTPVRVRPE